MADLIENVGDVLTVKPKVSAPAAPVAFPRIGTAARGEASPPLASIVEVTARAIEVLGTKEKALRWLNTPVRSLGDQTPLSLLNTEAGFTQVEDILGRVEQGVW